jgi:hypothetical protein
MSEQAVGPGTVFAEGGTVQGEGRIIRKDTGEVIHIQLTSDPLTPEQAAQLNQNTED